MNSSNKPLATGDDQQASPVAASAHSNPTAQPSERTLLSIDCGLKAGLALFTLSGKLLWYRSQNFGSRQRLKKAAFSLIREIEGLSHLVIEGGGTLADVWRKEGERYGLTVQVVYAEQWREKLLLPRQQRTGKQAKQVADDLAREIIGRSGSTKPTSLRHDAAEAILVGWWATQQN